MNRALSELIADFRKLQKEKADYDAQDYEVLRAGYLDLLSPKPSMAQYTIPIIAIFFIGALALFIDGFMAALRTKFFKDPAILAGGPCTLIFGYMLYGHVTEYLGNRRMKPSDREQVLHALLSEGLITQREMDQILKKSHPT